MAARATRLMFSPATGAGGLISLLVAGGGCSALSHNAGCARGTVLFGAGVRGFVFLLVFLLVGGYAYAAGSIVDSRITPEVILDGMTHYDADQGLQDYTVDILEVTRETDKSEVTQKQKIYYFLAPNIYLTMVGDKPESLANDASFMLLLAQYDLVRGDDKEVNDELCYTVVATPKESAFKKYTKTYYVSKADFRKIRIESIRSEMDYEFIRYEIDYYYDEFTDGTKTTLLVSESKASAYDNDKNLLMEQTNVYSNYKFDTGLTKDFFDRILEKYNIYYSEGT